MNTDLILALVPVAILIALGYGLRHHTSLLPEAFWPPAERLSYFILLPSLFLHGLATADLGDIPVALLALCLIVPILVVSLGLVVLRRVLSIEGPEFTSVFQGGIRFNNYVGVMAAIGLFGPPGAALAAMANAALVPTVNILSVLIFSRHTAVTPDLLSTLRSILKNPLILACAFGVLLRVSGIGLPPGLDGTLKALGQAALPLGLLCVGAALTGDALRRSPRLTLIASLAKFLAMPAVTIAACLLFGLRGPAAYVAVLFHALPTASSSYVLARQLGGDAPLMASIIAVQTIIGMITLPLTFLIVEVLF